MPSVVVSVSVQHVYLCVLNVNMRHTKKHLGKKKLWSLAAEYFLLWCGSEALHRWALTVPSEGLCTVFARNDRLRSTAGQNLHVCAEQWGNIPTVLIGIWQIHAFGLKFKYFPISLLKVYTLICHVMSAAFVFCVCSKWLSVSSQIISFIFSFVASICYFCYAMILWKMNRQATGASSLNTFFWEASSPQD